MIVVKGTPSKAKGRQAPGRPPGAGWLTLGPLPSASFKFKLPIANADPSHPAGPAAMPENWKAPGQVGAGPLRARVRPCEAQGPSNLKSAQPNLNLGQTEVRSGQVRYITRPKSRTMAAAGVSESHKAAYAASEHRHLKSSYARIVT